MEDATKGGVSANSYATITEADDLLDALYGADEWVGVSDDDKSRLLITATSQIDELNIRIRFASADPLQALNFPLVTPSGADGFSEAKKACIYQAFYIFENSGSIKEARVGKIQGVRLEQIAKMKRVSSGFNIFSKYAPTALRLLAPYIDMSLKIGRG